MKSTVLKRFLALALCVMMLCSMLSVGVSAAEAVPLTGAEIALPPAEEMSAEDISAEEVPAEAPPAEETPAQDGETGEEGGTSSDTGSDSDIEINKEIFPDDNLRNIVYKFDGDGNGWLSEEEISNVQHFSAGGCGIADLTGLEIFTGLTYISVDNNDITTLDASLFPNLDYLSCYNCPNLESLNLLGCSSLTGLECHNTALTELNLSECPNLSSLICFGTGLTELNFTDCPALAEAAGTTPEVTSDGLSYEGETGSFCCDEGVVLICPEAGLPEPSVSLKIDSDIFPDPIFRTYLHAYCDGDGDGYLTTAEQEAVTYIDFTDHTDYNLLESLEGIQYFTNLSSLYCNNGGIDTLDLSSNTELYRLECENNGMTELNLSGLTKLRYLNCEGNRLTELDISDCAGLKELKCSSNHDLAELDVTNCPNIINAVEYGLEQTADGFRSFYNELPLYGANLLWIDSDVLISGAVAAVSGVAITDVNFPDMAFRTLVANNYDNDPQNGWLTSKEIAKVTSMSMGGSVADYKGLEYFTELTSFQCMSGVNTALDLSANTKLKTLYLQDCASLTDLSIDGCAALESITIMGCPVAELDVSGLTALVRLSCTGNYYIGQMESSLTALDASGCTALEVLIAEGNALTSIELTGCTALRELDVSGNQLGSLDVSECTALEILDCAYTGLSAIDVSMLPNLKELDCGRNYEIKELDISNCTQLTSLSCDENKLTELDLSGYSDLEYLYCNDNAIKELDLTGCTALRYALVNNNAFDTLDIGDCPELIYAVENGEIDGSANAVASDIHFEAETAAGKVYFTLDEHVAIVGADVPAGCLISAYNFPDSGFRASVVDALREYTGEAVSEYDFVLFSAFEEVREIRCDWSDTVSLEGLSYFPNLTSLSISAEGVTEVDLTLVPGLETLDVSGSGITELDLSLVPGLTTLQLSHTGIEELDLSCVPDLTCLDCACSSVTALDLTANQTLWNSLAGVYPNEMGWELEDGSIVYTYEYYDSDGFMLLGCNQNTVITPALDSPELVDMFPDAAFRAYVKENFDTDGDGLLSDAELAAVERIDCSGLDIASLEGLQYFENLRILDCSYNDLTEIYLDGCPNLVTLNCEYNSITALSVNQLDLYQLSVSGNPLTALRVNGIPTLVELSCSDCGLTELNVDNNEALEVLHCDNNDLTYLNLYGNPELRVLSCQGTKLTELYIDNNEWLIYTLESVEPVTTEAGSIKHRLRDDTYNLWLEYDEGLSIVYESGSGDTGGSGGDVNDELAALYVEYLAETLSPALENGTMEAGAFEEIIVLADAREYAILEEVGLYSGELVPGFVPMTIEEFAASLEAPAAPDITGDGQMDKADVEVILGYIVLMDTTLADSPELLAVANVNDDDVVDARDATQVLRYASGLKSVLG